MQLGRGFTVLLGGARSGKSDLAVQLGNAWPGGVVFLATATAGDDDMADRIARHRDERPSTWDLIEAPTLCAADLATMAADSLLIVDCVTLLVANLMFADQRESEIVEHVALLGAALVAREAPSLVITNEVGLGIHPETPMGREYRDILGRANRTLAAQSETSLFVAAGKVLPLTDLDITW